MTLNSQHRILDGSIGLWAIGLGILFPLFFQIDGGIYREVDLLVDSRGVLTKLPLPVSTLTCLVGLVLLARHLGRARIGLAMMVGTLAVCLISLWLGGDGLTPPDRKVIMILQVLLPQAGLLLGQMVDDRGKVIARAFLLALSIVVPWQLLATKFQGDHVLTHYLHVFSIYSHRQYVTLIFVCAFAYSLTSLWEEYKLWLGMLTLLMAVYIARSYSFLTILAYGSFIAAFSASKLWGYRSKAKWLVLAAVLLAAATVFGLGYSGKLEGPRTSTLFLGKFAEVIEGRIPSNVLERFDDWKSFGDGILQSPKTILVGHPEPMPREVRTSPHNWYIDIVYNFGLVGVLPILALTGYTFARCWRQRKTLPLDVWWLGVIVLYLVVVDSNFKVTLRQPYPGIFAYFMWGLLLTRLHTPLGSAAVSDNAAS